MVGKPRVMAPLFLCFVGPLVLGSPMKHLGTHFFPKVLDFFLLGAASPSLECLQLRMIPVISLSHACVDHWH